MLEREFYLSNGSWYFLNNETHQSLQICIFLFVLPNHMFLLLPNSGWYRQS